MTDIYLNYDVFTKEVSDLEKIIRDELNVYKQKCTGNESTIDLESNIRALFKQHKEKVSKLKTAYNKKNVPGGIPDATIDKRQGDIQQLEINYGNLEKTFNNLEKEKYRFKDVITEDYSQKEEYKNLTTGEIMVLEKKKLADQDERIEQITNDVIEGQKLAKHAGHVIKEQNKKLDQINEDIERTDQKMNTLTGRFERYVAGTSMCKMISIILVETAIAIILIVLFVD
jgi:chromosome segregation ATPase